MRLNTWWVLSSVYLDLFFMWKGNSFTNRSICARNIAVDLFIVCFFSYEAWLKTNKNVLQLGWKPIRTFCSGVDSTCWTGHIHVLLGSSWVQSQTHKCCQVYQTLFFRPLISFGWWNVSNTTLDELPSTETSCINVKQQMKAAPNPCCDCQASQEKECSRGGHNAALTRHWCCSGKIPLIMLVF
jgi:hypothetical protein